MGDSPSATRVPVPEGYDPFQQTLTLVGGNWVQFNVSVADLDYLRMYGIRLAINYGSQIGASIMLMLILILLTRAEKRRSTIFILNALCLALNSIRSILQSLYLTGNFFNPYGILALDASRDAWQDRSNTIAANTLTLLVVIIVYASLSMQVWVVCKTAPTLQKILIMGTTTIFALVAIGYRFAVTIISNDLVMQRKEYGMQYKQWLLDQMSIFQAVAIWVYCAVFSAKLGYALVQRRRLGLTQFGPMQIVFVMGAQTMVIPAIFSVLQFYKTVPELGSQSLTIVCIFLPLSAIWAGVVAAEPHSAANSAQRMLADQFGRRPTDGSGMNTVLGTTKMDTCGNSTMDNSLAGSKDPDSPGTPRHKRVHSDDGGIYVEQEWTVEKERGGDAADTATGRAESAHRGV